MDAYGLWLLASLNSLFFTECVLSYQLHIDSCLLSDEQLSMTGLVMYPNESAILASVRSRVNTLSTYLGIVSFEFLVQVAAEKTDLGFVFKSSVSQCHGIVLEHPFFMVQIDDKVTGLGSVGPCV